MATNEIAKYLSIYRKKKKDDEDELGGAWPDSTWASAGGTGFGTGAGTGGVGNAGGYVAPGGGVNMLSAFASGAPTQQEDQGSGGGGNEASRGLDDQGNANLGPNPGLPGTLDDARTGFGAVMPLGPLSLVSFIGLSEIEKAREDRALGLKTPRADLAELLGFFAPQPATLAPQNPDYGVDPYGGPTTTPSQVDQDLANQQAGGQFGDPTGGPNSGYGGGGVGSGGGSGDTGTGGAGGEAGGDAAGCFLAGTPIMMADGSTKEIQDIREGDRVMAFDERACDGTLSVGTVTARMSTTRAGLVGVDGITVSDNHQFVAVEAGEGELLTWAKIGDLRVGDSLMRADGSLQKIKNLERLDDAATVYNFSVAPQRTYVAGGFRAHNIKIRGGEVYNLTGEDMAPGDNPDDTIISAKTNEWVIQEPVAEYYGPEIMTAFNEGEFPREMLEAALAGDGAEFTPRNSLRDMAPPSRGRNALAEFASVDEYDDDAGGTRVLGPGPIAKRHAAMRGNSHYEGPEGPGARIRRY